jgi:predicted nucleic acid-binding protein
MSGLLIDTSALITLGDRGDERHEQAVACRRGEARGQLYVTDYILDETLTLLRARHGANAARLLAAEVRDARGFNLVFVGPELFWAAEARFRKQSDRGRASFTDCASFAVIDHLRLDGAFAFDDDFRRAGYRVVPS